MSKAHPGPQTDVLLGRTYRDAAQYDRARVVLRRALKADPEVRRAHYYLGTTAILAEGLLGLDEAIREFKAELQVSPRDVLTNLRLGMALVEARRAAEAHPASRDRPEQRACRRPRPSTIWAARHLALDRAPEAVEAFRRALSLCGHHAGDDARVGNIHYQLALALRQSGNEAEAANHFEEASRASARRADTDRETLSRFLTDTGEPEPWRRVAARLAAGIADVRAAFRRWNVSSRRRSRARA